jgi:hypothetical protein
VLCSISGWAAKTRVFPATDYNLVGPQADRSLALTALAAGFADAVALGTLLLGANVDEAASADRAAGHGAGRWFVGGIVISVGCVLHVMNSC